MRKWWTLVEWEELRGNPSYLPHQIIVAPVFLLKLLAWPVLLAQESYQFADLDLLRNAGPHRRMIKACGCTVLEVVDHNGLEDAEAYRVIMTLPVLCPSHCTLQWCEGSVPCLLSHFLPAVLLLSYWGGTKHLWLLLVVMLEDMQQAIKQGQLSQWFFC